MKTSEVHMIATAMAKLLKDDFDEILTTVQASKILGITPRTLYDKVKNGELPHRKKFGRIYFSKSELTNYILKK